MQRYFLELGYEGTAFHGSQLQGELPTVQLAVNKALSTLLREPVASFGASRTDEGVHALGNYYHFDTERELHPHFQYKLNAILPPQIAVTRMFACVGEPLNARFDAIARSYRYRIYSQKDPFLLNRALFYPYRIDKAILDQTADIIKEYTDFESFSKRNTQTHTFRCTIYGSYWQINEGVLEYVVRANRFLRGMVRGLVGTQLQVARGNDSLEGFRSIIEAKDCTLADFSVAGHGLYLEHIEYPAGKLEELRLF